MRKRLTRTSEQLAEVIMKHQMQKELKLLRSLFLNFEKSRLIQGESKLDSFGTKECGKPGLEGSVPVPAASLSLLPQCVHLQKGETIYLA